MRSAAFVCLGLSLFGESPLAIVAVERRGWPPYEDDRRVYVLEGVGVEALRVGTRLQLHREDPRVDPGRLKVVLPGTRRAEAVLDARGKAYPLKGDRAEPLRGGGLPGLPALGELPDLPGPRPFGAAPGPAPSFRVLAAIYFLEGDGALSPKGREKVLAAVARWGKGGTWRLGLPEDRTLPVAVREARISGLRSALRSAGALQVEVAEAERAPGDRADVVYLGRR